MLYCIRHVARGLRQSLQIISILLVFTTITGCSSIMAIHEDTPLKPYQGFKKNISTLVNGEAVSFTFTLLDTPLSFLADTLLLPVALTSNPEQQAVDTTDEP